MASKALTEKHIPLNDQQGLPTQGASCLKTAKPPAPKCPSSKLPLLTQHSPQGHFNPHKVPPSQQDSEATCHVTASDSTTGAEPPLYSQRPRAPQTPYSSDTRTSDGPKSLACTLACTLPDLCCSCSSLGSGHGGGRLAAAAAAAAALPPAAGRPQGAGPRAGAGLRALGGATFAAAPFLVLISHLKTKLPTI